MMLLNFLLMSDAYHLCYNIITHVMFMICGIIKYRYVALLTTQFALIWY